MQERSKEQTLSAGQGWGQAFPKALKCSQTAQQPSFPRSFPVLGAMVK